MRAWGLRNDRVPAHLQVATIDLTEDAGQGGWANGTWKVDEHQTVGAVWSNFPIFDPDHGPPVLRLVREISIVDAGNTGPVPARIGLKPSNKAISPTAWVLQTDDLVSEPGGFLVMAQKRAYPLVVPPGHRLFITATNVDGTVTLNVAYLETFPGYKVD